MTGRIIYEPTIPTSCDRGMCADKPDAVRFRDGTVWECEHCGRHWIVWSGAQYNETFSAWRRATVEESAKVPAQPTDPAWPCRHCGSRDHNTGWHDHSRTESVGTRPTGQES